MPRVKASDKNATKVEAEVSRDSKNVGVLVSMGPDDRMHFPLGCTWRWNFVLGILMLEVLQESKVICQIKASVVDMVNGPSSTQPIWRSAEYPS
jgi:hypothetical protein